ncbi:FAD-dependent monooxygenase [Actinomycetospora chiangmaiensis]|uniref:FAD-dependent monooxygenase n=1 Tax=Actinomycetospora chiangmaiensis TaxID=402650 RepID=UPI000373F176|nr:FAD-dependent monooxygenase [Actinomycetospora chiangmaiensis]
MKITCVGGGPAGLYFAISAALRDGGHEITVIDRDPPGATYGWGVVYWDNLLDTLYRNDAESARALRAASALWREQRVTLDGRTAHLGGYGYSVGRAALLEILARRASDLGVDVRHDHAVTDAHDIPDADLVVAADGANSRVRSLSAGRFGTTVRSGANPYLWLGTDRVFRSFVFDFVPTPGGWVWCHAYPSSAGASTFIVECQPSTWEALGLDTLPVDETVSLLEGIFGDLLGGHRLLLAPRDRDVTWRRFTEVGNTHWYDGSVVLLGDAAHTTHFTIGSGTRLAINDAIALADRLYRHDNVLATALPGFERDRLPRISRVQAAARSSMAWFEHLDRYTDRDATDFAAAMCGRQGPLPAWRFLRHRTRQLLPVRTADRWLDNGRRTYLALRRGETLQPPRRPGRRHDRTPGHVDGSHGARTADGRAPGPQLQPLVEPQPSQT